MTDAYNVGLKYLMDKFPQHVHISFDREYKRGKIISEKQNKSLNCNRIVENDTINNEDKAIAFNVRDYHLAISVKRDLETCLERKGITFDKRYIK
jgi:hypothetical protein